LQYAGNKRSGYARIKQDCGLP